MSLESQLLTTRRQLLKAGLGASGSFTVAMSLPGCAGFSGPNEGENSHWQANAWLEIAPDSQVTFTLDRVEMGQGTYTGLTTLVAEELNMAPEKIMVIHAPVGSDYRNPDYGLQMTGGSNSLATSWLRIRQAGAIAREMLIEAAADTFKVAKEECTLKDGIVSHVSGKLIAIGDLASLAATYSVPGNPKLKKKSEFSVIGKQNQRLDAPKKVDGSTAYGIDTEVPGMVYAVLTRSPVYGGKVTSVDDSQASAQKGVLSVITTSRGVAVVAEQYWQARKAQALLKIDWDLGELAGFSSESMYKNFARLAETERGDVVREEGDYEEGRKDAAKLVTAKYQTPFLAHATLEPQNCVVDVRDDSAEVWAPTQAPDLARISVARVSQLSPSDVTVHTTVLGGGFGRRLTQDFVEEAAEIAFHVRKPVKLIWSREEDTQHDWYRPATYHEFEASIDKSGKVSGWRHKIVAPKLLDWYIRDAAPAQYSWAPKFSYSMLGSVGLAMQGILVPHDETAHEGASSIPYAFPNIEVSHIHSDAGVPVSFWRSVGHSQNAFYVESFVDELAYETGEDSYEYRRRLLSGSPRLLAVMDRVAAISDWNTKKINERFLGIAAHASFKSFVAQVAEVSVVNNQIKVHKVYCVVDCGFVVNPDIVRSQMESGIVFGLTAALHGEITYREGRVEQSNFHDYPLLRMNECPEIIVEIIDSDEPPTGVGEPSVPPVAPAVANAVFKATGSRLRSLPLRLS